MILIVPCPRCDHPVTDWKPWRVQGELSISFVCRCGHGWQVNGCSIALPPEGGPPDQLPPIDPAEI